MVTVLVFCRYRSVFLIAGQQDRRCAYIGHLLHVRENPQANGSRTIGKSHFRLPEKLPEKKSKISDDYKRAN